MKLLLKLVTSLSLVLGSTVNIIACNNKTDPKVDKNIGHIIRSLSSLNNSITLDEKATYKQLDNNIRKAFEITKLQPKLKDDFKIQYFTHTDSKQDLTNELQTITNITIVITIIDDPNYNGKTDFLPLTLIKPKTKIELATKITSLDSLKQKPVTVNPNENYSYLDSYLETASELTSLVPLLENYSFTYFDKPNGKEITNDKQESKIIWVVITAHNYQGSDPNYSDRTNFLVLNSLEKVSIKSKITTLNFPDNTVPFNPDLEYWFLDNSIVQSLQFRELDQQLKSGYTIKYYDKPKGKEITNAKQLILNFWVVITVSDDDLVYEGTTDYLPVSIGKIQLNKLVTYVFSNDFSWPIDKGTNNFSAFDRVIKDQLVKSKYFPEIDSNLTIMYSTNKDWPTNDLSNQPWVAGTFYFYILASSDDPYYQGQTDGFKVIFY